MKIPPQAMRRLLLLPDGFTGSITLHSNGHGVYSIEIRHQERFNVKDDQLVDFTNEMQPGGALDLKRPRR